MRLITIRNHFLDFIFSIIKPIKSPIKPYNIGRIIQPKAKNVNAHPSPVSALYIEHITVPLSHQKRVPKYFISKNNERKYSSNPNTKPRISPFCQYPIFFHLKFMSNVVLFGEIYKSFVKNEAD